MSTPAAAVLNGNSGAAAAGAAGGPAGGAPAAGGTAPAGPVGTAVPGNAAPGSAGQSAGAQSANDSFWNAWQAPEQKDVRDWVANKNYADPFTLAKSARELEQQSATLRAQANLKAYPAERTDAATGQVVKPTEQEVKAWNATMGVPESPDKYEIKLPENTAYPQFAGYLQKAMHEAGVPAAMAPKLAAGYEQAVTQVLQEVQAQENQRSELALAELKNAWGTNYQERVAFAQRGKEWLSKEVGGLNDQQMRALESSLGTDKFMAAMWKIGEGNREARFAGGNPAGAGFTDTASAAQAEYDKNNAERLAGKVNDYVWRSKVEPRQMQLLEIIARGQAPN